MKIFKKNTVETSNDYYEAYKAELNGKVEKKSFFSLSNLLKLEVLIVAVGVFILNQNGLSLELKKMYVAENNMLPVSMQKDNDLVVSLEDTHVEKITIREDTQNEMLTTKVLNEEAFVNNRDIKLLIELLQSEMEEKEESSATNRVIISQK